MTVTIWTNEGDDVFVRNDGVRVVLFPDRGPAKVDCWMIQNAPHYAQGITFFSSQMARTHADRVIPDQRAAQRMARDSAARDAYPLSSFSARLGDPPAVEKEREEPVAPTRASVLDTAKGYVTNDRQASYGDCEDNFANIASLWSTYLRTEVKPADVAAMMVLMKTARIMSSPGHTDNWTDIAGYAACGGEITGKKE